MTIFEWRAWRDLNPQPSDPKFSLIHNEINQQGVKRLENKAFPLSLFISVQLISYQCGNKDGNNEPCGVSGRGGWY